MTLKIKTIRGRGYYYNDVSKRVGGKVKTTSQYIGPVDPKRKRRGGGFGGLTLPTAIIGALAFAGMAAMGRLKTPHYKEKQREPLPVHRAKQIAEKQLEALDRHYAIDKTNADTFNASRARLPKEMQEAYQRAQMAAWRAVDAERERVSPPTPMSPEMKAFNDRLTAHRAEQAARTVTPSASAAPQGEEAAPDEGEVDAPAPR
jgi:hypothetical protein